MLYVGQGPTEINTVQKSLTKEAVGQIRYSSEVAKY